MNMEEMLAGAAQRYTDIDRHLAAFGIDAKTDKAYFDNIGSFLLWVFLAMSEAKKTVIPVPQLWRGDRDHLANFLRGYPGVEGHYEITVDERLSWCVLAKHIPH